MDQQITETHNSIADNITGDSILQCCFLLPTVTRIQMTAHNMCSQPQFRHMLSTGLQVSVRHTGQHVIKSILFVNFIQVQYALPLSSTSNLLAVYSNPTPKIQCITSHAKSLCPQMGPV